MTHDITFKKAAIHFIYPFLPVKDGVALDREALEQIAACHSDIAGCQGEFGKPYNRKGLSAYVALDLDMAYLIFSELRGRVKNLDVVVEPTVRVFPLGSTCCMKVIVSDPNGEANIRPDDIHALLHLVSQKGNTRAENEITILNAQGYETLGERTTLFTLYTHVVEKIIESFNRDETTDEEEPDKRRLTLLGEGHFAKDVDEDHCPWVVTVLEPNESVLNAFCEAFADCANPREAKREAISEYTKDILPILYRAVQKADFQVDPAYPNLVGHDSASGVHNMNIDARLFVHMSRRSILCLCENQEEDPAGYFLPVLIDLCEMIHARSNTLILLNKILDKSLKNFSDPKLSANEQLHRIIKLINQFTSCLEDPTAYVISGDALREIQEKLVDTTRIDSLGTVVFRKLDLLERMYKYQLDLSWSDRIAPFDTSDDADPINFSTEPAPHV